LRVTSQQSGSWVSPEAAQVWRQGAARRAQALAVATEQMLQAAAIRAGMRVLDVAAGTGDQTVLAAQRVGPSGIVVASDISSSMLEAAAEAARESGLHNVQTLVADASTADFASEGFDAAICRFGLMFVPDVDQACARIRRALKSGARFATLVWSTEEKNPYIGLQLSLLREMDRMPSPLPSLCRSTRSKRRASSRQSLTH
jgi:ubiquinone/menaquinone biosynthesis C-methylase UbiE